MDFENLVRVVAAKILPGNLLVIVTSDLGVELCLDSSRHWHERFNTTDQNHGRWPVEKILISFVCMRGYVMPISTDLDFSAFANRVEEYAETHKRALSDELMMALKRADQALTS